MYYCYFQLIWNWFLQIPKICFLQKCAEISFFFFYWNYHLETETGKKQYYYCHYYYCVVTPHYYLKSSPSPHLLFYLLPLVFFSATRLTPMPLFAEALLHLSPSFFLFCAPPGCTFFIKVIKVKNNVFDKKYYFIELQETRTLN